MCVCAHTRVYVCVCLPPLPLSGISFHISICFSFCVFEYLLSLLPPSLLLPLLLLLLPFFFLVFLYFLFLSFFSLPSFLFSCFSISPFLLLTPFVPSFSSPTSFPSPCSVCMCFSTHSSTNFPNALRPQTRVQPTLHHLLCDGRVTYSGPLAMFWDLKIFFHMYLISTTTNNNNKK